MKRVISIILKGMLGLLLLFVLSANQALASISIGWDPVTTNEDGTYCADLEGYMIYYDLDYPDDTYAGTGLIQGDSPIKVPISILSDSSNPNFTLSGLITAVDYKIVITAYDTASNESKYSEKLLVSDAVGSSPTSISSASTSSGGGGCSLSKFSSDIESSIFLFLPLLIVGIIKQFKRFGCFD